MFGSMWAWPVILLVAVADAMFLWVVLTELPRVAPEVARPLALALGLVLVAEVVGPLSEAGLLGGLLWFSVGASAPAGSEWALMGAMFAILVVSWVPFLVRAGAVVATAWAVRALARRLRERADAADRAAGE